MCLLLLLCHMELFSLLIFVVRKAEYKLSERNVQTMRQIRGLILTPYKLYKKRKLHFILLSVTVLVTNESKKLILFINYMEYQGAFKVSKYITYSDSAFQENSQRVFKIVF